MKLSKFLKTMALVTFLAGFFSWGQTLPVMEDGSFDLSGEQKTRLKASNSNGDALTDAEIESMIGKINTELQQLKAQDQQATQFESVREMLAKMAKENDVDPEALKAAASDGSGGNITMAQLEALNSKLADAKTQIKALEKLDVGDPAAIASNLIKKGDMHNDTHVLASGADWDAKTDRPWNAAAISGSINATTDWGDKLAVERLQKDTNHFYRINPDTIKSLFRDDETLPSFWKWIYNVSDRISTASIVTGEVSSARKLGWQPKNKQAIKAEEGRVFPIQIDLEWEGYELQKLETSWLQDMNKEGSQAYKKSFIEFLLIDIVKNARLEDRQGMINGVYSPIPEGANIVGKAIHKMDGILIQLWRAYYIAKKYKVAAIAAPTQSNILDHEVDIIEKNLKEDIKNTNGLKFYMSPSWMRKRMIRKRELFGGDNNYTGTELMEIENYPNIQICPLRDLEGTDFMFITLEDNIRPMAHVKNEDSLFQFDSLKRQFFVYADYKKGIKFDHIGNVVSDTDPDAFKVQTVWTNGQPIFKSSYDVTIYDDTSGIFTAIYSKMRVDETWATNITEIKGQFPGQIIKLTGSSSATGNVTDNTKIELAGDAPFSLATTGTLTLVVKDDLTVKELKRTANLPSAPEAVEFTATTIDSVEGSEFKFIGGANATLAGILNPIEGRIIKIFGNGDATFTLNDLAGNVSVASAAVLALDADFIELTVVDGVFTETNRVIAVV
jgi:hypothetical protein